MTIEFIFQCLNKILLVWLLVINVNPTYAAFVNFSSKDQVKVEIENRAKDLQHVVSDVDVHNFDINQGFITIYADKTEQTNLQIAGFDFHVIIADLANYYAQRAINDRQTRQLQNHSMGGFRTLAEIERTLDQLIQAFPDIVAKFSIEIGRAHV